MEDSRPFESRGHLPFSRDAEDLGHYQYTGPTAPLSAVLATSRQTEMIRSALRKYGLYHLLDIGCGDGRLTIKLSSVAHSILGLDPSGEAIRAAQSQSDLPENVEFIHSRLEDLEPTTSPFDVAIFRGVIHHSEDPKALLTAAAAIANFVIVLEPNGLNPLLKLIERFSPYHRAHGERSFRRKRINEWLSEAGFEVLSSSVGVVVPYFAPSWLAQILSRIEPLVEAIPFVRNILCGTQVVVGRRDIGAVSR
jgi:2-polyprenyl-3-methyl-5-hydroxy-6-metoxy-1,4-benzoquinol methylase